MSHVTPPELDAVFARAKVDDALGRKIASAVALIEGILDDVGESAVALSFNGGKDCTVLLHLFAAVLYERHRAVANGHSPPHGKLPPVSSTHTSSTKLRAPVPVRSAAAQAYLDAPVAPPPPLPACVQTLQDQGETPDSLRCATSSATHHTPVDRDHAAPYPLIRSVYFTAPNPFPALEAFVIDCATRYAMDLYRFGGGMKAALQEYLACQGGKKIKAILLGTRQGDPNGDVAVIAPTDPSWPQVLRVHPVLDWTYAEVWDFLRELHVPWCRLYDEGYTSLGSTNNTHRNPLLKTESGWEPAWKLEDESQERAGRVACQRPTQTTAAT